MSIPSANDLITAITQPLADRQRDIIFGRFGLGSFKKPQTLAALGNKFGVTRERIRQIETSALKALRTKVAVHAGCKAVLDSGKKFLRSNGGIAKADALLGNLQSVAREMDASQLGLLIAASGAFLEHPEDEEYWPFYYSDKKVLDQAVKTIREISTFLKQNRSDVLSGRYEEVLKRYIKTKGVNRTFVESVAGMTKTLHRSPYGEVGLAEWAEIKPATVRDRIYLVLKKSNMPLHFETIASTINELKFPGRRAIPATVHNELIKDERFVLVGRGMYALSEAGYEPGTAREVIRRILKNGGPLRPKDVVLAVQKERFLKANTILVNLQNKTHFERMQDGTYKVREA